MPTKRGWLGFVLVITSAAPLGAQATRGESARVGTVRGQVSAAESLTPLSHVSVTASGLETQTSAGVLTDDEGWFTLSGLAVGTYTLRVERLGYATLQLADVVVRSGRITFVEASLTAVPLEVEGLVVTGGFFPQPEDQPVSMSSYSGEEIRRAPGSAGDVSRIFMTLPSVAKVSDQSNGLAVRGGSPRENAFFVDNVEIPNINHFPTQGSSSGPIGLLNTDLIRDATFFTGGFPAPYGDRLSSVMEIELREGDRSEFDGQVDLSLAGAGVVVEGPLGDEGSASYVLSARKSFLDLLVDAIGTESDVVPRYSDGTLKIVWDEGARHRVTALGVGGIDEISASRAAAMENGQIVYGDHSGSEAAVGLDWRALWSDRLVSHTTLSYLETRYRDRYWETTTDGDLVDNDSYEGAISLRQVDQLHLGPGHSVRFGLDAKLLVTEYANSMGAYTGSLGATLPPLTVDESIDAARIGLFASWVSRPWPRLSLTLGLRSDYFGYTDDLSVSPRAALSYRLDDRTSLNASTGLFRQSLPLVLLTQYSANRDLVEPSALHFVAGVERLLTDDIRLTLEAYWKEYRDFPLDPAEPGLFLIDELVYRYGFFFNPPNLTSDGRARARGTELLVQKKLARDVYGLASVSYSRSQYDAGDGTWRDRVYDNRWTASAEGGYKPNSSWEFSARWIYAGGRPYTPLDIPASQAAGRDVLDAALVNGVRHPAYHSLNVRFDRRFYFGESNLVWYVSVWNAYNRQNIAAYYWNAITGEQDTLNQWGMLPVFGLEYEF